MLESKLIKEGVDSGLIINLAPTGCVIGKQHTPHIPITHNEIVDDVAECIELGVQMVHLHVRDEEGQHSSDPERYGRLIEAIRALPAGRELIICISTSGRHDPSYEYRSRVLELDGDMKPDMASLTLSSLNFMQSASINEPKTVRQLAEKMLEKGIKPELEIFDLGMINFSRVLIKEGLIQGPAYANILLGNIAGAQASLENLSVMLSSLPNEIIVSLAGLGQYQQTANLMGIIFADGVRVGLEDNIWFDSKREKLAKNVDLVERVCNHATSSERGLIPTKNLREKLFIPLFEEEDTLPQSAS